MIVPGDGPKNAKIVLIGEAPGETEEQTGRPFVGASGKELDRMLARAGIDRKECYVTNVVKVRPPKNNFNVFYENARKFIPTPYLSQCIQELHAEIRAIKPNLIVPLGDEALAAMTSKRHITNWRGSVFMTEHGKVMPTFHPSYVMRMYKSKVIVEHDLKRAKMESLTPIYTPVESHFVLRPSFERVMEFLQSKPKRVAFDVETSGPYIRCIGFATSRKDAICIPFMCSSEQVRAGDTTMFNVSSGSEMLNSFWSLSDEVEILKALNSFLSNPEIEKYAQNYPFDAFRLAKDFGINVRGLYLDTMVGHHCCYCEMPKGLDFLASLYTPIPYWSDHDPGSDEQTWIYNCWDNVATFWCGEVIEQEMRAFNVWDYYKEFKEPAMIALTRAGLRGIEIDQKVRLERKVICEDKIKKMLEEMKAFCGEDLNPNSPKQIQQILYVKYGLKVMKNRDGGVTTDDEAITKLIKMYPRYAKLLNLILDCRGERKLIGTYLDTKLSPQGRMRTSYNVAVASSARISSSTLIIEEEGGNLQNIPRGDFRKMYRAPEGRILVMGDGSQAEARAVAWLSHDKFLIEHFDDPRFDIHRFNALAVFEVLGPITGVLVRGMPYTEVLSLFSRISKDQRQNAKHCLHSANYGGGPKTAVKHAGVSWDQAKRALDAYTSPANNPPLNEWWNRVKAQVNSTRTLRTPHGCMRIFMDRVTNDLYRSAISFVPQSVVGDIINRGFYQLDKNLPYGAFPILQVHDEIIVECRPQQVSRVANLFRLYLEVPTKFDGVDKPLVIPVELKVGPSWGEKTPIEDWLKQHPDVPQDL